MRSSPVNSRSPLIPLWQHQLVRTDPASVCLWQLWLAASRVTHRSGQTDRRVCVVLCVSAAAVSRQGTSQPHKGSRVCETEPLSALTADWFPLLSLSLLSFGNQLIFSLTTVETNCRDRTYYTFIHNLFIINLDLLAYALVICYRIKTYDIVPNKFSSMLP